ncbi:MAG: O-antigen ligase family protein [Phycisphaerales bacterium]|nr:O-antigen ligase family protein [Phycisphaerales bacterium]
MERVERTDLRGQRLHLLFGMLSCALLAAPTSLVEFAIIPVGLFWIIRWPWMWPAARWSFATPVFLAALAFTAWQAISLSWSGDPRVGIEEFGTARFAWGLVMLYPVLNRGRGFVLALALGFLAGNLSQLLHAAGRQWHIDWLTWPRRPDRNSGWWDPAVGGTLLVAALGLHLPVAFMGRGRARRVAGIMTVITLFAIFATGTRGAWIGGLALTALAALVAIARIRPRRRAGLTLVSAAAVVIIAAGLAWFSAGESIRARFEAGRAEVRSALVEGNYNTDTGARLAMAGWAWRLFTEHPVRGVGVGGYRPAVEDLLRRQGVDPASRALHDHAHNALLHALATTGLVGAALLIAMLATGLRGLIRTALREGPGTYAAGPLFAMTGLVLMTPFDAFQVNTQTAALMWLFLGLGAAPNARASAEHEPGPAA